MECLSSGGRVLSENFISQNNQSEKPETITAVSSPYFKFYKNIVKEKELNDKPDKISSN